MKQQMSGLKSWQSALSNRKTQIHVATSDFTEQWAIFGQGALRISARELQIEMNSIEKAIGKKVKKIQEEKPVIKNIYKQGSGRNFRKMAKRGII